MAAKKGDRPDWRRHERDMSRELGLPQTVASGAVWFSKDDVSSLGRLSGGDIQFTADAKSTIHKTYALDREFMKEHCLRASRNGKVFLLPVRFDSPRTGDADDFIVLSLEDFRYLFGFDDAQHLREEAEASKKRRTSITSRILRAVSALNGFAAHAQIPVKEKSVVFNAVDEIEKALQEL